MTGSAGDRLVEGVHAERVDVEVAADGHIAAPSVLRSGICRQTEAALRGRRSGLVEREHGVRGLRGCHGSLPAEVRCSLRSNYLGATITSWSFDVKTLLLEASVMAGPPERDHVDRFLEEIRGELPEAMDLVVRGDRRSHPGDQLAPAEDARRDPQALRPGLGRLAGAECAAVGGKSLTGAPPASSHGTRISPAVR